jgi:ribosomal protein S18 acetylase RimI-like enzyme
MIIREATKADVAGIVKLLNSAEELRETKDRVYTAGSVISCLKNHINVVLVCADGPKVLGVLIGEAWHDKGFAYVANIVIDAKARKEGLGSMLYRHFESQCRRKKIRLICLFVKTSNKHMQTWSEKKGFKRGSSFYYYEKDI